MTDLDVIAPATGRVVGQVADMAAADVQAAVASLREAAGGWAALPVQERVRWLRRFRDWLLDNERELAIILQEETGKPWAEANIEIPYIVEAINYYTRLAPKQLRVSRPRRHGALAAVKNQLLLWRPYPVVGIITPWNFPLGLSLLDAVPALVAGATVAIKPSEYTPLTVLAAQRGWIEIGAPPVLAVVTGSGQTGAALVDHVDYVQFTGSAKTGRAVAHSAAERLIPCGLELGGKDAMIVLSDANLERAANAAVWGAMANAGQMCTSVERVYVHADVYARFLDLVVAKVDSLRVGADDQSYRVDVGPLTTWEQHRIVVDQVEDALSKGAIAAAGGPSARGFGTSGTFYPPTVLTNVDHSMSCMREETFGPLLPVMGFSADKEAVQLANDSRYGLSATIFTNDRRRAEQLAHHLDVGAVNINDVFANLFTLALPQGGQRESGIGTRNGTVAILKYCRPKTVVTARLQLHREPTWYPYTALRGALVHRAARLIGGRSLIRKLWQ
ncbi:succinate-semialdehyde dehydrogenase[NADP+] 2 [Mycolicibacterium phlei]|uniref:aldehyde dehydrogenase family protein n=1 Tax=Mycobacteroides chelonae TaxID=1774 RepID=UPI000619B954|nr:aldehyde dehydrogenase family protein [Mycobacteroides chelonae]ANB00571.1 aldehyde dehydrogenase [Mycobacteroides chelonae CCUG 47445]OLT81720.1 aldehyde dehydrogenase [Mycobacteroides chelonae]ORV14461.1 aldehyde dehydrogenase [Mycobacteroides chelonae]VEG20527.1 succinate-semialdehyde dehydrogenase[NADP+] 2 [Mycolicibacterium phlei]